jgi:hypothetical protein
MLKVVIQFDSWHDARTHWYIMMIVHLKSWVVLELTIDDITLMYNKDGVEPKGKVLILKNALWLSIDKIEPKI